MEASFGEALSTHGNEDLDPSFKQEPEESLPKKPGLIKRIFPTGFKYEFLQLLKYAWPIVLAQFFNTFVRVSMTIFAGHLGKLELGGATMGLSFLNLIGNSISIGLIAVCDTYFSQSFGSPNKFQVGIYLQTGLYVTTLCCVVAATPLVNIRNIMLQLGQDPTISLYTEQFVMRFLPALFCIAYYQITTRYLTIQGIMLPSVIVGFISTIIHLGMQYLLTYTLNMRLAGTVAAMDVAYFNLAFFLFLYVAISKVYKKTWAGWSRESLEDWGGFLKFGVFSVMMISIEWWTFEISFFLMGLLGTVDIGASSILYQIWSFYSSFSKGIGSACAYRVGKYLGASRIQGAITAARVAIILAYMMSIISATITLALHYPLPMAFSSDKDVLALARQMLPILAIFAFFGSAKDICAGIVRGIGKQVLGGCVTVISFGCIALPVGIPLMFYTSAGAAGFWWGLNIGLAIASTSLITIVLRVDWKVEGERALERAKVTRKKKEKADSKTCSQMMKSTEQSYGSVELVCVAAVERSPAYWRRLIVKRVVIAILCLAMFGFGLVCRFILFVPPGIHSTSNSTITNTTLSNFSLSAT